MAMAMGRASQPSPKGQRALSDGEIVCQCCSDYKELSTSSKLLRHSRGRLNTEDF